MENIIKVDQAMKSIKEAILKTDDAQIIEDCEYLCDNFASFFCGFLSDITFLEKYSQSPSISESDLMKIDDFIAEILLKNIRPGKDSKRDNTRHVI